MNSSSTWIDLSRLAEVPQCAVFFKSAEEVELFFHNCESQLAEFIGYWELEEAVGRWKNDNSVGFTFMTGDSVENMTWCDRNWFRECGYELVEFSDLANPIEIEESEMPLCVLIA